MFGSLLSRSVGFSEKAIVRTPYAIVDVPTSTSQGGPEIKSSHSTPNLMDGPKLPMGFRVLLPTTPDKHLLGLHFLDQRLGLGQRVSDTLWRRCMHI